MDEVPDPLPDAVSRAQRARDRGTPPIVVVAVRAGSPARCAAAACGVRAQRPLTSSPTISLYRTALAILVLLTRSARLPLPLAPVRSALMEWGRATELSADRAAALVTRDPLVVCRTLMSLAAGAMVDQLDLDLFMRQG